MFLLYINDIVEWINFFIRFFTSETSLYIIGDDPIQAADQLNSEPLGSDI